MVKYEIDDILKNDFDYLWNDLWKKNVENKFYKNEYNDSKRKFDILKNNEKLVSILKNINLNFEKVYQILNMSELSSVYRYQRFNNAMVSYDYKTGNYINC
jgi:hypothetical protein